MLRIRMYDGKAKGAVVTVQNKDHPRTEHKVMRCIKAILEAEHFDFEDV